MKLTATGFAGMTACALFLGLSTASADGLSRTTSGTSTTGTQSIVTFSGYDQSRDASYIFQGVQVALNGDIGRDGFMIRAYGSQVDYDYQNGATPTHGIGRQGDLMIGYKASRGNIWGAAFIGVDYQDHKLTPDDPSNTVRGSATGLKVSGDLASLREQGPVYFSLSGRTRPPSTATGRAPVSAATSTATASRWDRSSLPSAIRALMRRVSAASSPSI